MAFSAPLPSVLLQEVAEQFPGALELFDTAYPRLSTANDLRFAIDVWKVNQPRLTAYSEALPMERHRVVGWWKLGDIFDKPVYLAARWDHTVMVWVRIDAPLTWRGKGKWRKRGDC